MALLGLGTTANVPGAYRTKKKYDFAVHFAPQLQWEKIIRILKVQAGRVQVRFPMKSLKFSTYLISPASNRHMYQEPSWRHKASSM
jgi:hypothetical protein